MEDDLLTAVTLKDYPVVAPLPSLSNRLSIMDFQKISPCRMEYTDRRTDNTSHRTDCNTVRRTEHTDRRMDFSDRKHMNKIPALALTVPGNILNLFGHI